jgi:hypothetical protein
VRPERLRVPLAGSANYNRLRGKEASLEQEQEEPVKCNDFWDNVLAFVNEADSQCSKMVEARRLGDFEAAWLNRLPKDSWFVAAKPIAKKVAANCIRRHIKGLVANYRDDEKLLGCDFG